jgi:hypothetical protein
MQTHGRLHDALSRLLLAPGAFLQLVSPLHYTEVYRDP